MLTSARGAKFLTNTKDTPISDTGRSSQGYRGNEIMRKQTNETIAEIRSHSDASVDVEKSILVFG